jgi:hypothetical protein
MDFKRLLYSIIGIAIFFMVVSSIFTFFGIGFDVYGNYMLWLVAIIIFYTILPQEGSTIF